MNVVMSDGLLPREIPGAVGDAIEETLDLALWVRGFYRALTVTGFEPAEALQLTASAVSGLLNKNI